MALDTNTTKGKCIVGSMGIICFAVGILIGHLVTSSGGPSDAEIQETSSATSALMNNEETLKIPQDNVKQNKVRPIVVTSKDKYSSLSEDKWKSEKDVIQKLIDRIDPDRLKENLRYLTEQPHLAASPRDVVLANHIRDTFAASGFDVADLVPYNLLLSKPNPNNPNKVTLMQGQNVIFESSHKEKPIHADDEDPNFVHAFNAFTPAATVTTEPGVGVVYVNYGRLEDFEELERLGINITGHIAMARYGKIFRGNKIAHAQVAGAVGVLIFSDPADVALNGTDPMNVYDNTWWLPGTGMQRGTTYLGEGDPLTPGWPSTEHAYRLEIEEADLHNIPSQPLGYADARVILERLDGPIAPGSWQGGLNNMTYNLGPDFLTEFQDINIVFSTHNEEKIEENFNVIGIIKGSIEPDRYVMVGNHRDAWGYGASDPSSGTSQLLEVARVYGTLLKEGWRPRRSIVFCSWGAEEFGLIGSREWVEEHIDKIQDRTVAYINTDTCASGPKLHIDGSPMLWNVFHNITAMVPGVENPSRTMFDEWKAYFEELEPEAEEKPVMKTLASGSDFAPFSNLAGIPAADIWFKKDSIKYNITIYPFYHTGYETFHMVSTFIDPEFKIIQGCGRISSLALKYLADSSVLPYSITRYPEVMKKLLLENKYRQTLMNLYDKYGELENAVDRFMTATQNFQEKVSSMSEFDPLKLRAINDQLMKLEQTFIIPEGLPGRPNVRHAVFAPSQFDNYASAGFPGLTDLLFKYELLTDSEKMIKNKQIKRHISDLTILTDRATSLLKDNFLI